MFEYPYEMINGYVVISVDDRLSPNLKSER